MTDSVELKLRKNTFCGVFEEEAQAARALDVHRIVFRELGVKHEEVRCVQLELGIRKFYVKLDSEARLKQVLARRSVDYTLSDGTKTTVRLQDAGLGVVTVRVFRLPPEVDSSHVKNAFSRYGNVIEVYEEKWAKYEGCGLPNGVRGVKIELDQGVNIPSWFKIRGVEVKTDYFGQVETCRKCQERGHNLYDCPQRAINKPGGRRWEVNQTAANNNSNNISSRQRVEQPEPAQPAKPAPSAQTSEADDAADDSQSSGGEGSSEWRAAKGKRRNRHSRAATEKGREGPAASPAQVTKPTKSAATPPHATAAAVPTRAAPVPATTPSHSSAPPPLQLTDEQASEAEAIEEYLHEECGVDLEKERDAIQLHVQSGGTFDEYLQIYQDRLLEQPVTLTPPDPSYPKSKRKISSDDENSPLSQRVKS